MAVIRTLVVGTGGHGREVADLLMEAHRSGGEYRPEGFLDRDSSRWGSRILGLPVLGDWDWLDGEGLQWTRHLLDQGPFAVICAVGSPALSRRLCLEAQRRGLKLARAISPRAVISAFAELEEGVMIFPGAVVNCGARIGMGTTLNVGASVSHDCRVGPWCNLNPGARLAGCVTVGEGCYLGMGCQVIQDLTLGEWSVLGAGAVMVRSLPERVTAVGVPARVIKRHPPE